MFKMTVIEYVRSYIKAVPVICQIFDKVQTYVVNISESGKLDLIYEKYHNITQVLT
jgi:predicted RNA-binding protein with RPS1 domain